MSAYLRDRRRHLRASTLKQYDFALVGYFESLKQRDPMLTDMTRQTLVDYYGALLATCSPLTAGQRVRKVEAFWRWAFDQDEYDKCPRPRRIDLPEAAPALKPAAPTWAQMDAAIKAAEDMAYDHGARTGWYAKLFRVLRYTGLRRGQAMALTWDDVDLEEATLTVRPELGKSKQERRGRIVALSRHLVADLAGWGTRKGFLVPSNDSRTVHHGHVKTYWERTKAPSEVYRQPCHCFRKGFVSGLSELGVRDDIVKALVGHSRGVTGDVYTPHHRLMPAMREAVEMIPPVGGATEKVVTMEMHS